MRLGTCIFVGVFTVLAVFFAAPPAFAKPAAGVGDPSRLEVPGAPAAFFYRPKGKGQKPVVMYLHGRGANPAEDCRKWAKVATAFGWVVCPQGAEDRGNGVRSWNNDATSGERIMNATVGALRAKFKGRVQSKNNILVGFSEGAFVAMQVGLKEPSRWSRWLILAANDQYWFGRTKDDLKAARGKLKRVFLLTGESDEVAPATQRVADSLKSAKIPVRTRIQPGMGHEVPADRMVTNYRRPLLWLASAK
ncbi:MAG: hypothetical protein U0169_08670 [Polyangiaceae bacterium]